MMKAIYTGLLIICCVPAMLFSQGSFVQRGNDAFGVEIAALPGSFGTTLAAGLGLSFQGILDASLGFQRTFSAGYYTPNFNAITMGLELHPFKGKEKFPSGISFHAQNTFTFYKEINYHTINNQIIHVSSARFSAHPAPVMSAGASLYMGIQTGKNASLVPKVYVTRNFIKDHKNQWTIQPMFYYHSSGKKKDLVVGGGGPIVEGNFYLLLSLQMIGFLSASQHQ